MVSWFLRHAAADTSLPVRMQRLLSFFVEGGALMKECVTAHCEASEMFARRLGLPVETQQAVRYVYEQWDGKGVAFKRRGADAPVAARILHLTQAVEVAHSFGGPSAAQALAAERRGSDFDPELVDTLLQASGRPDFWRPLAEGSVERTVLDMAPPSARRPIHEAELDDVCLALADFADIKARRTWHHSSEVSNVAGQIASRLGTGTDPETVRRAGLVHDVGKAGVPCGIVARADDLAAADVERLGRHPAYTEQILGRVARLTPLAEAAGTHHEAVDGSGYPRKLSGAQIPLGGRVLRLADAYVLLLRRLPDAGLVLKDLQKMVGSEIDGDCFEALRGEPPSQRPPREALEPDRIASLTAREVEVLQAIAGGLSNRDVAKQLVISDKTVEHHLEHIYDKLGVSARTSAVVFAVHNGLV
jgi:putative nucleotidyltransferase with HDIG domain